MTQTLKELLAAELHADLQADWDHCLVSGFYKHPGGQSGKLAYHFMRARQIDFSTFRSLERTPRLDHHRACTVLRFICGYLPVLAKRLWQDGQNQWPAARETLAWLATSAIKTQTNESAQQRSEIAERNRDRRVFQQTMLDSAIAHGQRQAHNRGEQWAVCK